MKQFCEVVRKQESGSDIMPDKTACLEISLNIFHELSPIQSFTAFFDMYSLTAHPPSAQSFSGAENR
jgi:hypothetical protein